MSMSLYAKQIYDTMSHKHNGMEQRPLWKSYFHL